MAALCIMCWAALNTACTSEEPVASGKAGYFEATATLPGNAGTRVAFTEAADGKAAVALLEQAMVDLVITDYNMPEMDGRELIEYIRTQS